MMDIGSNFEKTWTEKIVSQAFCNERSYMANTSVIDISYSCLYTKDIVYLVRDLI